MQAKFPALISEMAVRGIKKSAIYARLGISGKSLYNKLNGVSPFTWDEVRVIQNVFFPDLDKEKLFERSD